MTWAGFALFGRVYLGTTFGPWAAVHGVTAPPYVTRWGLDYWDSKLWSGSPLHRMDTGPPGEELFTRFTLPPPAVATGGPPPVTSAAVPVVPGLFPDSFHFRRIGHCLAAILFGLVGAILGRLIAAGEDRPNQ
jgi:hypothetical protein